MLLIEGDVFRALREGEQADVPGSPGIELLHRPGEQSAGDTALLGSGRTVRGPKNPTFPHRVAKLEPTSCPSSFAPKAATWAAWCRP